MPSNTQGIVTRADAPLSRVAVAMAKAVTGVARQLACPDLGHVELRRESEAMHNQCVRRLTAFRRGERRLRVESAAERLLSAA
jgi:hypothetical protein